MNQTTVPGSSWEERKHETEKIENGRSEIKAKVDLRILEGHGKNNNF